MVLEVLILDLVDAGYGWFIQLAHLSRTLAVYIREHKRFFSKYCILMHFVCVCVRVRVLFVEDVSSTKSAGP